MNGTILEFGFASFELSQSPRLFNRGLITLLKKPFDTKNLYLDFSLKMIVLNSRANIIINKVMGISKFKFS